MNKLKKGNITTILLPIMFMILIAIIIATVFVYIQISIYLYDVKLNTFYIVQSSISKEDYENMAYREYKLNEPVLKKQINMLFEKNYLVNKNKKKGIVNIECSEVKVIDKSVDVLRHTKGKYKVPIICVKYKVTFNPLISLLGKEIEVKMHADIKLSLLEFK